MKEILDENDFFTGLFAMLAIRGLRGLSVRRRDFAPVVKQLYDRLESEADGRDLHLPFLILPDEIHSDSQTIEDGLAQAANMDVISRDNPRFENITITVAPEDAADLLDDLPGGRELYDALAEDFLKLYTSVPTR